MKRKSVIRFTASILLIATIICVITGIIKWPGLINAFGLTYRQVPMAMITDIHDWSGIMMAMFAAVHVFQFRNMLTRMIKEILQ